MPREGWREKREWLGERAWVEKVKKSTDNDKNISLTLHLVTRVGWRDVIVFYSLRYFSVFVLFIHIFSFLNAEVEEIFARAHAHVLNIYGNSFSEHIYRYRYHVYTNTLTHLYLEVLFTHMIIYTTKIPLLL